MKTFLSKINETLLCLIIGIIVIGVLCQAAGIFLVSDRAQYSIGLWIGIAVSIFCAWHMWWSLDRNLTIHADDEKGANAYSVRSSMVRYIIQIIVLAVICLTDFADPIATFLGLLSLKLGAYIAPYISNFFKNK